MAGSSTCSNDMVPYFSKQSSPAVDRSRHSDGKCTPCGNLVEVAALEKVYVCRLWRKTAGIETGHLTGLSDVDQREHGRRPDRSSSARPGPAWRRWPPPRQPRCPLAARCAVPLARRGAGLLRPSRSGRPQLSVQRLGMGRTPAVTKAENMMVVERKSLSDIVTPKIGTRSG